MSQKKKSELITFSSLPPDSLQTEQLHQTLRSLIATARQRAAKAINHELTCLYWAVGKQLKEEVLRDDRAAYGEQVVNDLGKRLAHEFGRGFDAKNLRRMIQFCTAFPNQEIVATLSRQLSWSVAPTPCLCTPKKGFSWPS